MTSIPRDPRRRRRLLRSLAISMVLAAACGALQFMAIWPPHTRSSWTFALVKPALRAAIFYSAAAWWIAFTILYFGFVRKSAATLEYQQRIRRDELRQKEKFGPDSRDS